MLLLIKFYYVFLEEGLNDTDNIKKYTSEHKKSVNIYLTFLKEKTTESKKHILVNELYDNFEKWFLDNNYSGPLGGLRSAACQLAGQIYFHLVFSCYNN